MQLGKASECVSTSPVAVRALTQDDPAVTRWDQFVRDHVEGTFCHLFGWQQVMRKAFGHRCYFLIAERDGAVVGVLPLVHIRSRIFGARLVSNAFCVYGGILSADAVAADRLAEEALSLRDELNANYVELRGGSAPSSGWQEKNDLYVTFRRAIDGDADVNLKAIPRKQRAVLRKALAAAELTEEVDTDIERFWHIYSRSVRDLGTPVFPKRYFSSLKETFAEACEISVVVDRRKQAVAAVLSFSFRNAIMPYYGGGLPEARKLGAYDFMYWSVMERARTRGQTEFDFGRSKVGTGAFAFKKNWGFQPEPLTYRFGMAEGHPLPDVNPLNPKYQRMIAVWKRLPLPVANCAGPWLARGLG